jgi:hypothetical protein
LSNEARTRLSFPRERTLRAPPGARAASAQEERCHQDRPGCAPDHLVERGRSPPRRDLSVSGCPRPAFPPLLLRREAPLCRDGGGTREPTRTRRQPADAQPPVFGEPGRNQAAGARSGTSRRVHYRTKVLARYLVALAKSEAHTALGEENAGIQVAEKWLRKLS